MFIKTIEGWKRIFVVAEPASDDSSYKGDYPPGCFDVGDPWAVRENRQRQGR